MLGNKQQYFPSICKRFVSQRAYDSISLTSNRAQSSQLLVSSSDGSNSSYKQGIIETYKLFARIDRNLDGYIDVADLIVYASSVGQSWTKQEAADILELIDEDQNGLISFDELLDWHRSGAPSLSDSAASFNVLSWRRAARRRDAPPHAPPLTVDAIVRDLFPMHVVHSLMRGERVRPERKDEVTVFFSDVVGFTELSAAAAAAGSGGGGEAASDLLDRLFGRLDALADRMGVTKVSSPCFAIRDQDLVPRSRDPGA